MAVQVALSAAPSVSGSNIVILTRLLLESVSRNAPSSGFKMSSNLLRAECGNGLLRRGSLRTTHPPADYSHYCGENYHSRTFSELCWGKLNARVVPKVGRCTAFATIITVAVVMVRVVLVSSQGKACVSPPGE